MLNKTFQKYMDSEEFKHPTTNKQKTKRSVYLNRLQKIIDRELHMGLWLAVNYPEIFLNRCGKINDFGTMYTPKNKVGLKGHTRLRLLLKTVIATKPEMGIELVLKRLEID